MTAKVPHLTFHNGYNMPAIGLGTWQAIAGVEEAVDLALQTGYRHIDTAYAYQNEASVGKVLKKWIDSGKINREDLFIVTKLPPCGNRAADVEKYLKKSLEALQLTYVDLYLIHHPIGMPEKEGQLYPTDKYGKVLIDYDTDIIGLWKGMEAQVNAGRARSIGLSNFNSSQKHRIVKSCKIRPANLQVELHVLFQQKELCAFCAALDVTVCAYAPLGSPGLEVVVRSMGGDVSKIPSESPLSNPTVQRIASKYHKTTAQVLLRHLIQRNIAVIPKSTNPDRIRENFDILDFELSEQDMDELNCLDRGPSGRRFGKEMAPGGAKHPEYPFNERY